jgi:hypothetical protein
MGTEEEKLKLVTRALDPRVHPFTKILSREKMDCRMKSGNDD